jgi:hypothetical protein
MPSLLPGARRAGSARRLILLFSVMVGPDPAIHENKDVDARH